MDLVFATHNPNKLEEVRAGLPPHFTVTSLASLGWVDEIPETESSLIGNSRQKAQAVYAKLGRNCFADDTGLEIDALGGQPGVLTARFAGVGATMQANRAKVLLLMKDQENRAARFRTVLTLIWNGRVYTFEGCVEGRIAEEERGGGSFGYDSLFIPSGYDVTYAEMPFAERNTMSHRAQALGKLTAALELLR